MSRYQNSDKFLDCDVLVVGAGPAGCCAALKAKEHGLNVILLEKADAKWSGSAGRGIDLLHILGQCATGQEAIEVTQSAYQRFYDDKLLANPNVIYRLWEKEAWTLKELERYVTLKWYDGDYLWFKWGGGYHSAELRIPGLKIKPELAAAVRQAKVNLLNHTMLVDLLTNKGRIVGATAANTRSGEFLVIKTNAVVVATGGLGRHYEPELPQTKFRFKYHHCPSAISGDGVAAAYRAGAELVNMELMEGGVPHTDYCCITRGCLVGVRPFQRREYTWDGQELSAVIGAYSEVTKREFAELERKGKTPIYRTFEHFNDELQKWVEITVADEGFVNLKLSEDRGFDPRTHWYDVSADKPYPIDVSSLQLPSLAVDENFMTSLKGLYGIGDTASGTGGVVSGAVAGFLVGDNVENFISRAGEPVVDEAEVENQRQVALAPLGVKDGQEPIEFECAIRHICERYIGIFKSEGKLREGIRRLGSLRRVFLPKLMAENPHYLMRCLEARNVMDIAELHMQACLSRKETRGFFNRIDYPEKDPTRDGKLTYQRMEGGKAVLEIREAPKLKPEFAKEGR